MPRRSRLPLALATATAACALAPPHIAVEPDATFAAHQEHRGLVIDRLAGGRTATLGPAGWIRLPGEPTFVLDADGERVAAFWLSGERVVVRRTSSETSPVVAEITPSWEDGAIRLTLQADGGPPFRTDVFARAGPGIGPDRLTRIAQTVLDVRGKYETAVRDAGGVRVGSLRVRVGPYLPSPRIFDGVLPGSLSPELAVAAAAALNAEIDWIEDHVLNVYRGAGSAPLERSIPATR